LLADGATAEELAHETYWAAYTGLGRVPQDIGFTETLTTIFGFIDALQSKSPDASLRTAGFSLPSSPSLFDYVNAFKEKATAAAAKARARSDIAEIAQDSFTKVLVNQTASASQTLFGFDPAQARQALQANLKSSMLGHTMHEFFASFTSHYLNYYLGRELPYHVGHGKAFANIKEHSDFSRAFDLHVRQTVRIADEFTPGWFGKARWEGRLSHKDVSQFAHIAFKKIRSEFRRSV